MASKPSATCQGTSFVRSCPPDRLPGQAVALGITLSLDSCVVAVRGGAHQEGVVHKEAQGLGGGKGNAAVVRCGIAIAAISAQSAANCQPDWATGLLSAAACPS